MTLDQFTGTLFNTTSSEYSPTPPRDESKGKGIATEENPLKDLIPLMDEGGSAPKMPNRLAMLKQEKEKSKARLKVLTPAEIRARAQKLAEFEAKRKRMLEEYNHYITYRADQHLIIKISYKINKSTKHATMRIERNNQTTESLQNLIPPPGVEGSRGLVIREPKIQSAIQKGTPEAEELFKKMELAIEARNDVSQARLIVKDNLDGLSQHILAKCKTSASGEGLAECKASASNLERIRVKGIVKEVEDYLKTYSSVGMDISWMHGNSAEMPYDISETRGNAPKKRGNVSKIMSLAFKVLGQPTSSSSCERNWSTYSFIHSLRRNKLSPKHAEDLVFIHNNLRLLSYSIDQYNEEKTMMWDVGGDDFGTLEDTSFLEFVSLSLDKPEIERVFFSEDTITT
ncbi:reverse transcriptase domain-containing protein [Tanacetum coccineum]